MKHHNAANNATAASDENTGSGRTAENRFGRADRLLDAASYSRVFGKARRSKDRLFTVLYRNNGKRGARLGLAVSKKNCRLAAGRNRLKRLVRESFRINKSALHGLDIVVLNQAGTHKADNATLRDSLEEHWKRCVQHAASHSGRESGDSA